MELKVSVVKTHGTNCKSCQYCSYAQFYGQVAGEYDWICHNSEYNEEWIPNNCPGKARPIESLEPNDFSRN